jgi:hypothetical protein
MNDPIREAFERICVPSFISDSYGPGARKLNGEYAMTVLEDHWQTFQEGWEAATESAVKVLDALDKVNDVKYCKDCGAELMSSMTTTCYGCNQTAYYIKNYKQVIRNDSRCVTGGWEVDEVITKVEQFMRSYPNGDMKNLIEAAFSETVHE